MLMQPALQQAEVVAEHLRNASGVTYIAQLVIMIAPSRKGDIYMGRNHP